MEDVFKNNDISKLVGFEDAIQIYHKDTWTNAIVLEKTGETFKIVDKETNQSIDLPIFKVISEDVNFEVILVHGNLLYCPSLDEEVFWRRMDSSFEPRDENDAIDKLNETLADSIHCDECVRDGSCLFIPPNMFENVELRAFIDKMFGDAMVQELADKRNGFEQLPINLQMEFGRDVLRMKAIMTDRLCDLVTREWSRGNSKCIPSLELERIYTRLREEFT